MVVLLQLQWRQVGAGAEGGAGPGSLPRGALSQRLAPRARSAASRPRAPPRLLMTITMSIFAVAGCLFARGLRARLVADLSPARRCSARYMALSTLSWQIGFALGPAVCGFVLDFSPGPQGLGRRHSALRAGRIGSALRGGRILQPQRRRAPRRARLGVSVGGRLQGLGSRR